MKTSEELPTVFACTLGLKTGLLLERKRGVDPADYNEHMERMKWFQQMAVTSSFEDCVQVYYDKDLTEEQFSVLKLIHRTTKPWMAGHVVGVLMDKIGNQRMANRDFAESVRVLTEQIGQTGEGEMTKKMNGIVVRKAQEQ